MEEMLSLSRRFFLDLEEEDSLELIYFFFFAFKPKE